MHATGPLMTIDHSSVRASEIALTGGLAVDGATKGQRALLVTSSKVVLARPRVAGGGGSIGFECYGVPATAGGTGLEARSSEVLVIGTEDDYVLGGPGGCLHDCVDGCYWWPDPAYGAVLTASDMVFSRVVIEDGEGDDNWPDWTGDTFTRDDSYPWMELGQRPLRIGGRATVGLDAVQQGSAILLISDQGGTSSAGSRWSGPPLSVLPGLIYVVADLGRTDAIGDISIDLTVPRDDALVGLTYHAQIAFFGDTGEYFLSNSVSKTVGNLSR
jgi:hypothetical protein